MPSNPPRRFPLAYFLTFTTYGTWLHGNERGSTDRIHNIPDTPYLADNPRRVRFEQGQLRESALQLDESMRQRVLQAILEVCAHRQWHIHAAHVRSNHVHVIVSGDATPEKIMADFKAYATRALRTFGVLACRRKFWTRHGSTRYLWTPAALEEKIHYVCQGQGRIMALGSYQP